MLKKVVAVLLPLTEQFELGVACEVFGFDRSDEGLPTYDFSLIAGVPDTIRTRVGYTIDVPHDLDRLDSLILMNDSVYGPFWNLRDTLAKIDIATTDFWGITDSFENLHHIQTFFMVFMPNALRSTALKNFWTRLLYINHRMWVIRNAEVKLTHVLQDAQLKVGVLAPYGAVAEIAQARLAHQATPDVGHAAFERFRAQIMKDGVVNPTQFFWDVLITDYACPFIKRDLLTSNPNNVPGTSRWGDLISEHSSYDVGMIARHLAR